MSKNHVEFEDGRVLGDIEAGPLSTQRHGPSNDANAHKKKKKSEWISREKRSDKSQNTDSTASATNFGNGVATDSRAVWTGRLVFIGCLSAVAAVLCALAYHFLHNSEKKLAETQFESIADRALTEAVRIAQRKRFAITSMAEITARMLPEAHQWPFVYIDGFTEITSKLLNTVAAEEEVSILTFAPLVPLEQQEEWEEYAFDFYNKIANYPNGTGAVGIWSYDATFTPQHDTEGIVVGAEQNWPFLFPAFQLKSGYSPVLLFNLRSGLSRALAIDSMVKCAQQRVLRLNNTNAQEGDEEKDILPGNSCGAVTDMEPIFGLDHRGLAAVLYEPIFPENNGRPTILAGFLATVLLMDETLSNVFADTVSGVDAVYTTNHGDAITYSVENGKAFPKGQGDLHDHSFDSFRRSTVLTDKDLYTESSPTYTLALYPNEDLYDAYTSKFPAIVAAGAVMSILVTAICFLVFDFFVRKEFRAKRELLETKRRFMRFVSHEVRTPLNSVCMGLSVMENELKSLFPSADKQGDGSNGHKNATTTETSFDKAAEIVDLAREIQNHAISTADVLNDFLHYDKIENASLRLELSFLSVWDVVEHTANEFVVPASNKNIGLEIRFAVNEEVGSRPLSGQRSPELQTSAASMKGLPSSAQRLLFVGDKIRSVQVIRNLVSNAIKFTPDGGKILVQAIWQETKEKTIVCSSDLGIEHDPELEVECCGSIAITVADTGVGMSPEQLHELFRPGVQFNANKLQHGGGSGLGLYIAKGIVEQHKGRLTVASEGLGRGTTFSVNLPVCFVPGLQESTRLFQEESSDSLREEGTESLRILIVDDSLSNRKLLYRLLKSEGHQCSKAEDGKIALEMISTAIETNEPYDCVLLDYEMPTMNGPDAAKEIRRRGYDLFVVGITGNVLQDDVSFFMSCGANAVLPKPIKLVDLRRIWVEYGLTGSQQDG